MRQIESSVCLTWLLLTFSLQGCAFTAPGASGGTDTDASQGVPDASQGVPDASQGVPDASQGQPDASVTQPDASVTQPDAAQPPGCDQWTPQHFMPCQIPPSPTGGLILGPGQWTYNTDSATFTPTPAGPFSPADVDQPGGVQVNLISVESFELQSGATLQVEGSKPLIIASWTTILIEGVLDAGSKSNGASGAGNQPPACSSNAPTVGSGSDAGGGGGGGGFGGAGGDGGNGDGAAGGTGGTIADPSPPTTVRGGCAGARGGRTGNGPPGAGGGAIELAAFTSITVNNTITSGGAGGEGGGQTNDEGGGGGAGSGGYVGLDSQDVTLGSGAILAANGGGGGEGGDGRGGDGENGPAGVGFAQGGSGQGGASDGGRGGNGGNPNGASVTSSSGNGGGGGGGGVGFILVWATTLDNQSSMISPPLIQP